MCMYKHIKWKIKNAGISLMLYTKQINVLQTHKSQPL